MPKIQYITRKFSTDTQNIIEKANEIISEYEEQGFDLTLRQLYYQFVARDLIPNTQQSYKRLGSIVNDGRLAGLIDWSRITDRTRNLESLSHWDSPSEIIGSAATSYRLDKWANQPFRPEVWIEKEALAGVFEEVCESLDVPYFSCRGYTSQSEMWAAGQRLRRWKKGDQTPVIFHFGDHDPSGMDMTRDIVDRLEMFMGGCKLKRLALNMDQVQKYSPPPNPAKTTDSRYAGYITKFGDESWELDALEPRVLAALVRKSILKLRDVKTWKEDEKREATGKRQIEDAADQWSEVVRMLDGEDSGD